MMIEFYKYQGTGNDFIILDNRQQQYSGLSNRQVQQLCHRRFGIGADGLMLLNSKEGYDFEMAYYNADGNVSSMCGNGGRCLVKFAAQMGIRRSSYHFWAIDGPHEAEIETDGTVSLKMADVHGIAHHGGHYVLNTGSPHFVKFAKDILEVDMVATGREIRYGKEFAAEGINVNIVETTGEDSIYVRTYERGVEDETMSCGTGVTAAALVSAHNERGFNRVEVSTPGGQLSVEFDKIDDNDFTNVWLCGPAEFVYKGIVNNE
jgi:diaminopimelate epimerase